MKKLLIFASIAILAACSAPQEKEAAEAAAPVERSIGFNTFLPDNQWFLGTEATIEVVKDLDKVWAEKNYEAMAPYFVDTCKFFFPDGVVLDSPQAFIERMKEEDDGSEDAWTFDYAFSVDLDPTRGGEHVHAGFTGSSISEGDTTMKRYHERYYVIDGKIVMWHQYTQEIKGK